MPTQPLQNNSHTDRRALLALRMLVVALILALLGWLAAIGRTSDQVILISLGILGASVLALPILFDRNYDIFEPMTAIFFLFFFGAPLKLCYIATVQDTNPYVVDRLLNDGPLGALIPGVLMAIGGLVALVVGYMLPAHRRAVPYLLFPSLSRWSTKKLQLICLAIVAFSGVCFCLFVVTAGVTLNDISGKRFSGEEGSNAARVFSYKYYLYRFAAFAKFPAYLSFAWLTFYRKSYRSWFGALCVISALQAMLICIVISNRAGVAILLLDFILIGYFVRGRKMNLLKVSAFMLAAIVGVMGILSVRSDRAGGVGKVFETTMAGRDMMDITKTAHIINAVPDKIGYRNGEMLYAWATAFVPKSVWPNKPMWIERGPYIMQNVYDRKNRIAGIPPGFVAELYWNFGWMGLLFGMSLFGYLVKLFYRSYLSVPLNPASAIIYAFFVTRFVLFTLGSDLGTGVIKLGLDLVPLLMILLVCQKRRDHLAVDYQQSSLAGSELDRVPHRHQPSLS